MANGFGSMFIGVAGLQSSQNALNVTSNNLANLDTTGYVRQSVLFADRDYVTFNTTAAISNQQSGLGVTIGDVVHSRDVFLDRLYRTESSRQSFYASTSEALTEVQNYYQELEGQAFQDALTDFWGSFQELYKYPEDSVYQNLVIQKAQLFTSRSSAVYSGLKSYQYNINSQISDDIDQVNELGKTISELNLQIQKIEAGNIETAMTLRDARDLALDELASLVDISYKEEVNGVVRVSVEGNEFVNENGYYKVEKQKLESMFKIYFFDERIFTGTYVAGVARPETKAACISDTGYKATTVTHELLHLLSLEHPFVEESKYLFKKSSTENLMDYDEDENNIDDRKSLWYWQIRQIWNQLK